jgi:hypothetical protein
MKPTFWRITTLMLLVLLIGVGVALSAPKASPVRLAAQYPTDMLLEEARTMNDCAECHETAQFHTCATCHDEHGAVELERVPFYAVIALSGDVPEPGYVLLNEVLPYPEHPNTHIPLLDALAQQGVTAFEQVTLASDDEGFVTVTRDNLTDEALLMPYADGVRFAAPNLHISAWIKGITRIIVVGAETPLEVDGEATSIGRLLLGPTRSVTVEEAEVMLKSEEDGAVRTARVASRITGVPLAEVVADPDFTTLTVEDAAGETHTLTAEAAADALLSQVQGRTTLVLPERGRGRWIDDVVALDTQG